MKKLIVAMLLIICVTIVRAGDKEKWIKEREEVIKRIRQYENIIVQYEQIIENNKFRLAQLDFGIDYLQKQEAKKKDKKKKKGKKK